MSRDVRVAVQILIDDRHSAGVLPLQWRKIRAEASTYGVVVVYQQPAQVLDFVFHIENTQARRQLYR